MAYYTKLGLYDVIVVKKKSSDPALFHYIMLTL